MFIYKTGYWSHEECSSTLLQSEIYYTQEQFNDIVSDCYVKCYALYKDENLNTVTELYDYVTTMLIKEHSFDVYFPNAVFMPYGWEQFDNSSKNDVDCKLLKLIRNKINNHEKPIK